MNCYLNNLECLLIGTNMTLRFKMVMQLSVTKNSLTSCKERSVFCMYYIRMKMSFDRYYKKINWGSRVQQKLKDWTDRKKNRNKKRKLHLNLIHKKAVLIIKIPEQGEQQVTPPIKSSLRTYQNGVKQELLNMKILECLSVDEKLMLRL